MLSILHLLVLKSFSGHLNEFFCPGAPAIEKRVQNAHPLSPHLDSGVLEGVHGTEGEGELGASQFKSQSLVVEESAFFFFFP